MIPRYEFSLAGDYCKRRVVFAQDSEQAFEILKIIAQCNDLKFEGITPKLLQE